MLESNLTTRLFVLSALDFGMSAIPDVVGAAASETAVAFVAAAGNFGNSDIAAAAEHRPYNFDIAASFETAVTDSGKSVAVVAAHRSTQY